MNKISLIISLFFAFFINSQSKINIGDMLPANHVKNGTVDYTTIIQDCINKYDIIIFPDFPVLINDKGLKLKSNSKYYFPEKSLLILKPSDKSGYNILDCNNKENILISKPKIKGDKNSITRKGEWGFGISIRGSRNVSIIGADIEDCDGDGIYIGRFDNKISENISITNSFVRGSGRNGLSITSGIDITINDCSFYNSGGMAPNAGIDIEPNTYKDEILRVKLTNIRTGGNKASGLLINLVKLREKNFVQSKTVDVFVDNYKDVGSKIGIAIWTNRRNLFLYNPTGNIVIRKATLSSNKEPLRYFSNVQNEINVILNRLSISHPNRPEVERVVAMLQKEKKFRIINYDIK